MEIKGTIEYTLKIDKTGAHIEYESTIENDLAALVISHRLNEDIAVGIRNEKDMAKGKHKKAMSEMLDKVVAGKYGLGRVIDYFLQNYEDYKKHQFLTENKITVEEGVLSEEQVQQLVQMNNGSKED